MKHPEVIRPKRIGVFVSRQKAFQSALVWIPIYINVNKLALLIMGKHFFSMFPKVISPYRRVKENSLHKLWKQELQEKNN